MAEVSYTEHNLNQTGLENGFAELPRMDKILMLRDMDLLRVGWAVPGLGQLQFPYTYDDRNILDMMDMI